MRFLLMADTHIRGNRPEMRKDDYGVVQAGKWMHSMEIAHRNDAQILIAGDMFESPDVGKRTIATIARILRNAACPPIVIRGNHDTAFDNKDISNSPLNILDSAGLIRYLPDGEKLVIEGVAIYGHGWKSDRITPGEHKFNILLAHAQVYASKPPPWMTKAHTALGFMQANPGFDLYVVGDIHVPCHVKHVNQQLIVPGSLMRLKSDQVDYRPAVWLFDTADGSVEKIYLPIEDDVFDMEKIAKLHEEETQKLEIESKLEEMRQKLVQAYGGHSDSVKPDFKINLAAVNQDASEDVLVEIRACVPGGM